MKNHLEVKNNMPIKTISNISKKINKKGFDIYSKSNLSSLSAICFFGLAAFIYFSVWFGDGREPWPTVGNGDVSIRAGFTTVALACSLVSSLALMAKVHGTVTKDIRTNFIFGGFVVLLVSVILYLCAVGEATMGFYVFLSSVISGLGTYLLIFAVKEKF